MPTLPTRRSAPGTSLIEEAAQVFDFRPRPLASRPEPVVMPQTVPVAAPVPVPEVGPALASTLVRVTPAQTPSEARRSPAPHRSGAIDRAALTRAGMIDPAQSTTLLAEEFRAIKRPILLDAFGARGHDAVERGRMVLVGSARPGDGKTFCALNLALSLAGEKDTAVLLVDADFAKPSIPTALGLPASQGLLDALRDGRSDVEGFVIDTDLEGLSVLPAGTPGRDDTELLTSKRAEGVLDALLLADPRRLIVFDTSPILAATPAAVLARHVGQVLFVVRADRTTETDVSEAIGAFGDDARMHLMINAVSFAPAGRRFGSYYGQGGVA